MDIIEEYDFNSKLSFLAEWYDYQAQYHKNFILNYYPYDNTLNIFDRDLNRMYLKRMKMDELDSDDMFVGSTLRIYGRQIKITGYADCKTEKFVGKRKGRVFCLLKPRVIHNLGKIITHIQDHSFRISRLRMCILSRKEALEFYEDRKGDELLPFILEQTVSGPVIAMEFVGENAILRFKKELGPSNPLEAKKVAPNSIRALFGVHSQATSGFYCSKSLEAAIKDANFFFPNGNNYIPQTTVGKNNTTCCVIKPHIISEGNLGHLISSITESHFKITAAQMFYLSSSNADRLLDVYKGIISDYNALLLSFLDGPCLALEIAGKESEMNVHQEFRRFCGPSDSEIARKIRPGTLRAIYGCDKFKNAIHCTDLPEDTVIELDYFFKLLRD